MSLSAYREKLGLNLEQCARAIGLSEKSKGYVARLESGERKAPIALAFDIEAWSQGEVDAECLLSDEDAARVRRHDRIATSSALAPAAAHA